MRVADEKLDTRMENIFMCRVNLLTLMGARRGGQRGALAPPLEFEKMTSYTAILQNTLKFSLAPSALAIHTLHFSLKRRKNVKMVDLSHGAPKNGRFFIRRAENLSTF